MMACPLLEPRAEVFAISRSNVLVRTESSILQFRGEDTAGLLLTLDGSVTVQSLYAIYGISRTDTVLKRLQEANLLSSSGDFRVSLGDICDSAGRPVRVVPTYSYLSDALARDVERARQAGEPWAVLRAGTLNLWLGPLFNVGNAPCWDCFLRRLASQDDRWGLLSRIAEPRHAPLNVSSDGSMLVVESGVLLQIEIASRKIKRHHVVSYPGCPACAGKCRSAPRPSVQAKTLREKVEQQVSHLIDSVTGIVTEITMDIGASKTPLHVAAARFADPTAGNLCEYGFDALTGRIIRNDVVSRTAFGAGASIGDASAKAVLEALERYCMIAHGDEETLLASFRELQDVALHPNLLMNYSSEQLRSPNVAIRGVTRELRVPKPFDEDARISWSPIVSLSGVRKYVPTAYCYDGFRRQPDACYSVYDTNGGAIAFSLEEAIVHGFLELVERDAVSIWWYNQIARPSVELPTSLNGFLDRFGKELSVFDITHDLGIPVFAAVLGPLFGFGAHFDARRAFSAALNELGQAICFADQEKKKWAGVEWAAQPHLTSGVASRRPIASYPEAANLATLHHCVEVATSAGLEIFVRDCTRPEIGLPSVRVIVPGLRHIWPRFGPGRLWDVPVQLGWLPEPTTPSKRNPEHLRS